MKLTLKREATVTIILTEEQAGWLGALAGNISHERPSPVSKFFSDFFGELLEVGVEVPRSATVIQVRDGKIFAIPRDVAPFDGGP